jgi:hypothetical protein
LFVAAVVHGLVDRLTSAAYRVPSLGVLALSHRSLHQFTKWALASATGEANAMPINQSQ